MSGRQSVKNGKSVDTWTVWSHQHFDSSKLMGSYSGNPGTTNSTSYYFCFERTKCWGKDSLVKLAFHGCSQRSSCFPCISGPPEGRPLVLAAGDSRNIYGCWTSGDPCFNPKSAWGYGSGLSPLVKEHRTLGEKSGRKVDAGESVSRDISKAPGCYGDIPKREFPTLLTPKLSHILQGL